MTKKKRLFAAWNNECAYCGRIAVGLDHIIPVARGGTRTWSNLVPACGQCNYRKATQPIEQFLCNDWLTIHGIMYTAARLAPQLEQQARIDLEKPVEKPQMIDGGLKLPLSVASGTNWIFDGSGEFIGGVRESEEIVRIVNASM